jgi:hypothetical protein
MAEGEEIVTLTPDKNVLKTLLPKEPKWDSESKSKEGSPTMCQNFTKHVPTF